MSPITIEQVKQFEMLMADAAQSLMHPIAALPDNGQGYAFFQRGDVIATLSTNPYARWLVGAYGLTSTDPQNVHDVIAFFRAHNVPARVRLIPGRFSIQQADLLASLGLRHTEFHTVLYSALPLPTEPPSSQITIHHVTDPAEYDLALDTYHQGWGMASDPNSHLVKIRRPWRTIENYRTYLVRCDGRPAGFAMLYTAGALAYLSSASTIPACRSRGIQSALIQHRIRDAIALGCTTILGGAEFDSHSRSNMMRAGLQIAYIAAIWNQPIPPLPHEQNRL